VGSASSHPRYVGLDKAGDCLSKQLLAAGKAIDAKDRCAISLDSPHTLIRLMRVFDRRLASRATQIIGRPKKGSPSRRT
jgi:hypothetical protein